MKDIKGHERTFMLERVLRVDLSRAIDDMEQILRVCPGQSKAVMNALSILRHWQRDESLAEADRERIACLIDEFG